MLTERQLYNGAGSGINATVSEKEVVQCQGSISEQATTTSF